MKGRGRAAQWLLVTMFAMPCAAFEVVQAEMLGAVNRARARTQTCGDATMQAVPALEWSQVLAQSASNHSSDQATRQTMTHRGADGSSVAQRVTNAGYAWRAVGENVYSASWHAGAEEAVRAWLASPGHCRNLMSANYTHLGAGFADSGKQRYWTQVFAAPQ